MNSFFNAHLVPLPLPCHCKCFQIETSNKKNKNPGQQNSSACTFSQIYWFCQTVWGAIERPGGGGIEMQSVWDWGGSARQWVPGAQLYQHLSVLLFHPPNQPHSSAPTEQDSCLSLMCIKAMAWLTTPNERTVWNQTHIKQDSSWE